MWIVIITPASFETNHHESIVTESRLHAFIVTCSIELDYTILIYVTWLVKKQVLQLGYSSIYLKYIIELNLLFVFHIYSTKSACAHDSNACHVTRTPRYIWGIKGMHGCLCLWNSLSYIFHAVLMYIHVAT